MYVARDGSYILNDSIQDIDNNGEISVNPDMFECDSLMTPVIALLNKKGYKTEYCCQGHIMTHYPLEFDVFKGDTYELQTLRNFSVPYISFEKGVPSDNFLKPDFPYDSWYFEAKSTSFGRNKVTIDIKEADFFNLKSCDSFIIRARAEKFDNAIKKFGESYNDLNFYQDILTIINKLYEFVKKLPDINTQNSEHIKFCKIVI